MEIGGRDRVGGAGERASGEEPAAKGKPAEGSFEPDGAKASGKSEGAGKTEACGKGKASNRSETARPAGASGNVGDAAARSRQPVAGPRALPRTRFGVGAALAALILVVAIGIGGGFGSGRGGTGDATDANAPVTEVEVSVEGLAFTPSSIDVPQGNRLRVTLRNTGEQQHDLVFPGGASTGMIDPGKSGTVDVGVVTQNMEGWCSVAGHRQAGMTLAVVVDDTATSASGGGHAGHDSSSDALQPSYAELSAKPGEGFAAREASLDPAPDETTHHVALEAVEVDREVAPGRTQRTWTFNGTAPGPVLRGKVGDTFVVTLTNKGTMGHSIDFHAGDVAPDEPMRTIGPGESLTYTFTAKRSGIWLYHCGTKPFSAHLANGMYGAVIIDPPDLQPVDREYYLIQAEQYWSDDLSQGTSPQALRDVQPSAVVFNGYPFQYVHEPLTAKTGERVRIWVLSAGPNMDLAFHVVGAQFDTVWYEGAYRIRRGCDGSSLSGIDCDPFAPGKDPVGSAGSQGIDVAVAQGGFVEFVPTEAGTYTPLNHSVTFAERGATASLVVED
ncbi:MAG: multicopper oxidase domain-containing protein [Actinomycetaceae bacterium]|nr:multicopper oxidase domain-containing protein [Actinomycetaceae bacterium]